MDAVSKATIVALTPEGERICASAARISTTQGTAQEIFDAAGDREKDRRLIEKVLSSGHKSVIEHMTATVAFSNVSALAEAYWTECRLASFTVKSRRYVDFGDMGYHCPPALTGAAHSLYRQYMDRAFAGYRQLLALGVPKEDGRFLLPYSFCSHFYCTVNLRELLHILRGIRYGRGRRHAELQDLACQIWQQLSGLLPELAAEWDAPFSPAPADPAPPWQWGEPALLPPRQAGRVTLHQATPAPRDLLALAWGIARPGRGPLTDAAALLHDPRPRELEQLVYTFALEDITLSGITHLVRHRMQSVLVPPAEDVPGGRYILPDPVAALPEAQAAYRQCLDELCALAQEARQLPQLAEHRGYFALSGTLTNAAVTMNARQAVHFLRLRTCRRAQWEIREIAGAMRRALCGQLPELFGAVGPGCFMDGRCPEGRLSCGQMQAVREQFSGG